MMGGMGLCHEFEGASRYAESVTNSQQEDAGSTIKFLPRVALDWRRCAWLLSLLSIHAEMWQKLDAGFAEGWPLTVSFPSK
jgi:hypothetical protein